MYLLSLSCGRLHNSIKAYYAIDKWRYSNYEEKKEASSNATSYCTTCNENDKQLSILVDGECFLINFTVISFISYYYECNAD